MSEIFLFRKQKRKILVCQVDIYEFYSLAAVVLIDARGGVHAHVAKTTD